MKILMIALFCLSTTAFAGGYLSVPLVRVISNPDEFAGRQISVSGVASKKYDDRWVVYLDCESASATAIENGVAFRVPDGGETTDGTDIEMKYILIKGIFRLPPVAPRGVNGILESVQPIRVYPLFRELDRVVDDVSCSKPREP